MRVNIFDVKGQGFNRNAIKGAMVKAAEAAARVLKKYAPYSRKNPGQYRREGGPHLRDSFEVRVRGERIEVVNSAPHFRYVPYGTKPHYIFPKRAKALSFAGSTGKRKLRRKRSWVSDGEIVYTRYVRHPGTNPNPFMSKAVSEAQRVFAATLEE